VTDIVELALACYRRPLDYQDRLSLARPARGHGPAVVAGQRFAGGALRRGFGRPAQVQELRMRRLLHPAVVPRPGRRSASGPRVEPRRSSGANQGALPPVDAAVSSRPAAGRETWTDHYASRINEAWTALSRTPTALFRTASPISPWSRPGYGSPVGGRAVERPGPLSSPPSAGTTAPGAAPVAAATGVGWIESGGDDGAGGFYLDQFSISRSGFEPTGAMNSAPSSGVATVPESSIASATDRGRLVHFGCAGLASAGTARATGPAADCPGPGGARAVGQSRGNRSRLKRHCWKKCERTVPGSRSRSNRAGTDGAGAGRNGWRSNNSGWRSCSRAGAGGADQNRTGNRRNGDGWRPCRPSRPRPKGWPRHCGSSATAGAIAGRTGQNRTGQDRAGENGGMQAERSAWRNNEGPTGAG